MASYRLTEMEVAANQDDVISKYIFDCYHETNLKVENPGGRVKFTIADVFYHLENSGVQCLSLVHQKNVE